jgi:hypothetical protein
LYTNDYADGKLCQAEVLGKLRRFGAFMNRCAWRQTVLIRNSADDIYVLVACLDVDEPGTTNRRSSIAGENGDACYSASDRDPISAAN